MSMISAVIMTVGILELWVIYESRFRKRKPEIEKQIQETPSSGLRFENQSRGTRIYVFLFLYLTCIHYKFVISCCFPKKSLIQILVLDIIAYYITRLQECVYFCHSRMTSHQWLTFYNPPVRREEYCGLGIFLFLWIYENYWIMHKHEYSWVVKIGNTSEAVLRP